MPFGGIGTPNAKHFLALPSLPPKSPYRAVNMSSSSQDSAQQPSSDRQNGEEGSGTGPRGERRDSMVDEKNKKQENSAKVRPAELRRTNSGRRTELDKRPTTPRKDNRPEWNRAPSPKKETRPEKRQASPIKEERAHHLRNQPSWAQDLNKEAAQAPQKEFHLARPQYQEQLQKQQEYQRRQMEMQMQQQQMQMQQQQQQQQQVQMQIQQQQMQMQQPQPLQPSKDNSKLQVHLDLNLEVEVSLKARLHGDLMLSLFE
ncbi:hypothetical protein F4803DRAFT_419901 [Xylaria telfairii]|nr:hypothetical protein F4803DRAFT_419901 [Xylaria telfairii]